MPYTAAEMGVAVIIIAAIMVMSVVLVNGLSARPVSEPYSEFGVTGTDGDLSHMPRVLAVNQPGLIKVIVISHAGETQRFQLTLGWSARRGRLGLHPISAGSCVARRPEVLHLRSGRRGEMGVEHRLHHPGQRR